MEREDPHGRVGELLRYGKIESVDLAAGRVVVRVGEILTSNIRWLQGAAGGVQIWIRPTVGEQVTLLCPEGDIEGAIALRGVVSNAFPHIGDEDRDLIRFPDGAEIAYDDAAGELHVTLGDGGKAVVTAPGGISLIGDVDIQGKLSVTDDATFEGKVTAQGEIQSGDIKLTTHKHGGVSAGGAKTAVPE